ncbi:hypothetical protein JX266_008135 [Neoarthrinium moseri]|nr:hypothetical protein JX266_008135 [Neoarthrinium moseri]
MPVTEIVHLHTLSGNVDAAYRTVCLRCIQAQDEWCDANLPQQPKGLEARGVAVFQNTNDPSETLLTAHWDSVAEHGIWIASATNQEIFPLLQEQVDLSRLVYYHVDGVSAFSGSENPPLIPVLKAPVISLTHYCVSSERKQEFDRAWQGVKANLDGFARPYVHRGGWKIEKGEDAQEEVFVSVGGWQSVETAEGFMGSEEGKKFEETLDATAAKKVVKYFTRFL